jgi:ubiquinone/menaquinone biosynthesis C-methylase UbiE
MKSNTEWQLSGNAAQSYENYLVPTIFIPWAKLLLERAQLQNGEDVLDAACGTGIVSRMAKAIVGNQGRVVGVDLNGGMLAVAGNLSLAEHTNIEWIETDIGSMPLAGKSFDVAFCQHGLQFFPEKLAALKEIRRLLRPGGRCIICVAQGLEKNPLMRSQVDAYTKHDSGVAAEAIKTVCALNDSNELKKLFIDAGFADVQLDTVSLTLSHVNGAEFIANGIGATPASGLIAEWDENSRNALVTDILAGFGEYYDGQSLRFPHVSTVVIANNQ